MEDKRNQLGWGQMEGCLIVHIIKQRVPIIISYQLTVSLYGHIHQI